MFLMTRVVLTFLRQMIVALVVVECLVAVSP